ncbi:MAG: DUF45 domain-containing protein [Candidatus Peribacteraceae bacterium]|nr:DUF45 domain-containing protein [Candidatus Peribacteraceae bacterium]
MSSLPYRIERTHNRTSRASFDGDTILIRLARWLSASEEERHIATLLKRMAKAHAKHVERTLIDPFGPLLNGSGEATVVMGDGSERRFVIKSGDKIRATFKAGMWNIDLDPSMDRRTFHRFLWRLLSKSELGNVEELVLAINRETLRLPVRRVRLEIMGVRWGSCSRKGNINLNSALLFVPPSILRYVIIHELAHIKHPNHSAAFWRTVECVMPEYRIEIATIKHFRLPDLQK